MADYDRFNRAITLAKKISNEVGISKRRVENVNIAENLGRTQEKVQNLIIKIRGIRDNNMNINNNNNNQNGGRKTRRLKKSSRRTCRR